MFNQMDTNSQILHVKFKYVLSVTKANLVVFTEKEYLI